MTVNPGDRAPSFSAKVTDGQAVADFELEQALGDGPVVFGFFPFAFTEVCEDQMADLRDSLEAFKDEGATVFGLSTDSPFSLQVFHQEHGFGFPLISDYNREAVESFGLFYDELMGLEKPAKRATVVLDAEGTVAWTWTTDDPEQKPEIDEIRSIVRKVQQGETPVP